MNLETNIYIREIDVKSDTPFEREVFISKADGKTYLRLNGVNYVLYKKRPVEDYLIQLTSKLAIDETFLLKRDYYNEVKNHTLFKEGYLKPVLDKEIIVNYVYAYHSLRYEAKYIFGTVSEYYQERVPDKLQFTSYLAVPDYFIPDYNEDKAEYKGIKTLPGTQHTTYPYFRARLKNTLNKPFPYIFHRIPYLSNKSSYDRDNFENPEEAKFRDESIDGTRVLYNFDPTGPIPREINYYNLKEYNRNNYVAPREKISLKEALPGTLKPSNIGKDISKNLVIIVKVKHYG